MIRIASPYIDKCIDHGKHYGASWNFSIYDRVNDQYLETHQLYRYKVVSEDDMEFDMEFLNR